MATRKHLIARGLHHIKAFRFPADTREGSFETWRWLFQLLTTESTLCSILLVTSFTDVVWLFAAFNTEVLLTSIASNSILSHMFGCLMRYQLAFIILLSFDHIAWLHEHDVSALALDEVGIKFDHMHFLVILNCLLLFFT